MLHSKKPTIFHNVAHLRKYFAEIVLDSTHEEHLGRRIYKHSEVLNK